MRSGDDVNHPSHYNQGKIETIEFLEDQFMDRPHEWNAVKYIARAPHKGSEVKDLRKAIWYLERKIARLEAASGGKPLPRPNDMPSLKIPNLNEGAPGCPA